MNEELTPSQVEYLIRLTGEEGIILSAAISTFLKSLNEGQYKNEQNTLREILEKIHRAEKAAISEELNK